jgi:hypothetical protein
MEIRRLGAGDDDAVAAREQLFDHSGPRSVKLEWEFAKDR